MDQSKEAGQQTESKLHFLDYWRIIRIRKTVILLVFLLVVLTATLVTFILPEQFASTARIRVDKDKTDITGFTTGQLALGYDPYFIQTEFEVIQSEKILKPVIENERLMEVWGQEYGQKLTITEAMMILKGKMDLRPVRNTSIIEIRITDKKPEAAARLANAIATTYRNYRLTERTEMAMSGIRALEERMSEQDQIVRKQQEEVDRLRVELQIPDAFASENAPAPMMTGETLRRIEGLRIESQTAYSQAATLLNQLKTLSPEELTQAIPTAAQDSLLASLLEQLTLADQKLLSVRKDYGSEHPEVLKASTQVEDIRNKIKQRVVGIVKGLEVKVASMKEGLQNLEEEVDKAKKLDIQTAGQTRPYFDAKRRLDELQRMRQLLTQKIYFERTDVDLPSGNMVEIVDTAKEGLRPVKPNKALNIALGVVVGLVVGIGLAFFIEYLDTSVKTIDDVERTLGAPVLGVIPQNVGLLMHEGVDSPHAEAYRVLRTNLLFSRKSEGLNSLAVVSAGAGEGKSTTVFNLACVFAQSGQRILIVDSDLRRPSLHKLFKVTNNIGLTNLLLKQNSLEEVIQTTNLPTLDFMPSGKLPSSSLGILSSAQMRELIVELKSHYDFVFFDSPPVMGVSDASILASEVDMTMQVIQYRRYPQPMNIRAKQMIEKVGGNLVGIVLNNINMSQDESYYYYTGYYHDYYSRNEDQEPEKASASRSEKGKDKLDINKKY